jgi:hypothetical protein
MGEPQSLSRRSGEEKNPTVRKKVIPKIFMLRCFWNGTSRAWFRYILRALNMECYDGNYWYR